MPTIARDTLLSLETYARQRPQFRTRVLAHKKPRTVALGPNLTLIFEDELTVRYQVQEMLRVEKTFEEEGILDELAAYNPLIPDGSNLKATMMIEYEEVAERERQLRRLQGLEDRVYFEVAGLRCYAIADEDLDRDDGSKTSAVHFLRFEFEAAAVAAFKGGESVALGVDHPEYTARVESLPAATQIALAADFA